MISRLSQHKCLELAPINNWRSGTVPPSHLGGIGLDLMAAISAPHDQPHVSRSGVGKRHRRAGLGFQS
jgi:hypothetical protein